MTTLVDADTADVVTSTVALDAPCGTITVCGSAASVLADDSDTVTPPAGAAAASVMTARVGVPPTIDAALSASADSITVTGGGFTGELHALPSSAIEAARDTNAVRNLMMTVLLTATPAS